MADKVWKRAERIVAKIFGTVRTPLSGGSSRHTRSDTLHKKLFIEIKYRKKHGLMSLWREVKQQAKDEDKVPLIALREKGSKYTLIAVEVNDLENLIKNMER